MKTRLRLAIGLLFLLGTFQNCGKFQTGNDPSISVLNSSNAKLSDVAGNSIWKSECFYFANTPTLTSRYYYSLSNTVPASFTITELDYRDNNCTTMVDQVTVKENIAAITTNGVGWETTDQLVDSAWTYYDQATLTSDNSNCGGTFAVNVLKDVMGTSCAPDATSTNHVEYVNGQLMITLFSTDS